jgi:hypothetical protein
MSQKLAIVFIAIFITGCATTARVEIPPKVEFIDAPQLNIETISEVGDTLVEKGKIYTFEGIELFEDLSDGGAHREYVMQAHKLKLSTKDSAGNSYYAPNPPHYYVIDKTFGLRGYVSSPALVLTNGGSLKFEGTYDLSSAGVITNANPSYKSGSIIDLKQPNFKQSLIYNGKQGSVVKFTYREFSNDMVRSGFTQDVQYDLSESNIIGFKGVRVEVIHASNTQIVYKVLKSFPTYN